MIINKQPLSPLFGWAFTRKSDQLELPSFTPKTYDDGALNVTPTGYSGTYLDLDGAARTEGELITKYREISMHPEVDSAIDEIVNEAISIEENDPVKLILDDCPIDPKYKKIIEGVFHECLQILNFRQNGYDIFRKFYIDGRLNYHTIIDEEHPEFGVLECRYIDPRKIKKIREIVRKRPKKSQEQSMDVTINQAKNEYYVFNDKGFSAAYKWGGQQGTSGLKIAADSIINITSGLTDASGSLVLSHLHQAIKPVNQLRSLEDASIIYRLVRAPERRVWYLDVGNLPKMQAEAYMRDQMLKHKNKLVYDAATGEIRDDRKFMTILEDYWLARRDGKGTEVDTLPPGQNFNEIDDILFFQKKLYASLHIPVNRLDPNNQYIGITTATEISKDEVKFAKFIHRMRNRFSHLFVKLLEKQLVLKEIMTIEDYTEISKFFRFEFCKDNYFLEIQEAQVQSRKNEVLASMVPFVGTYYSNRWVQKNVLRQTDGEIEQIQQEIIDEMSNPLYNQSLLGNEEGEEEGEEGNGNPKKDNGPKQNKPAQKKSNVSKEDKEEEENQDETEEEKDKRHQVVQAKHEQKRLRGLVYKGPSDVTKLRSVSQFLARRT